MSFEAVYLYDILLAGDDVLQPTYWSAHFVLGPGA